MSEKDKEKTAFICPLGFYQFEQMPQGVTGAPATFQRLMEATVGDMNLLQCLVYLDDLIVFGKTLEEHEERLLKVLDRLEESGLKISLEKCQFCQAQVKYVGHIVSDLKTKDPEVSVLQRESHKIQIKDGLLHRVVQRSDKRVCQLILPTEYRHMVLRAMHDDMGHFGAERTLELIKDRFYWPEWPLGSLSMSRLVAGVWLGKPCPKELHPCNI